MKNGFKIALIKAEVPFALLYARVGAGFIDEGPNEVGIAHWTEHGVFRGTKRHPHRFQFMRALENLSIESNATTNFDKTDFYFISPKENIKQALSQMGDLLRDPLLRPEDMLDESEPVKAELKRRAVNPATLLFEDAIRLHAKLLG